MSGNLFRFCGFKRLTGTKKRLKISNNIYNFIALNMLKDYIIEIKLLEGTKANEIN